MPPTNFQTPNPNDATTRRDRNMRLSAHLTSNSDDITDVFLETLPSGKTRWKIVHRDGTVTIVS
ncbi:MAG: hypothetical protein EPO68_12905 [Planctomycetota bacterium]|nr:MAG: hypothetical protein EPO68_12905 [Planctomycetota bacterium]